MIIPRKTYDDDLISYSLMKEKTDVYAQGRRYIEKAIVDDWFRDPFVTEGVKRHNKCHYSELAWMIRDHCLAHSSDDFIALCPEQSIIPVFIPHHSSHMPQVLDVCLFPVTKREILKLN
jgi:hypothetical protein